MSNETKKNIIQVREFTINGKTLGLSYTTNAMVMLEEAFGVDSIYDLMTAWSERVPGMKDIRILAWGGMEGWRKAHRKNDPDYPPFDVDDAGDVMDALANETGMGALDALSDLLLSSSGLDVQKKVESELTSEGEGESPLETPTTQGGQD